MNWRETVFLKFGMGERSLPGDEKRARSSSERVVVGFSMGYQFWSHKKDKKNHIT